MAWGKSRPPDVQELKSRHDLSALATLFNEGADDAADALAELSDPGCVAHLVAALASQPDGTLRDRIAALLVRIGPAAVAAVATELTSPEEDVRTAAGSVLMRIGITSPVTVVDLLRGADSAVRDALTDILVKLGAIVEDALLELLTDPALPVQNAAADVLCRIETTQVEPLVRAMGGPNPYLCEAMAGQLQRMGDRAIPALIEALVSPNRALAEQAGSVLGQMGAPAVDALLEQLGSPAGAGNEVQITIIRILGQMRDVRATDRLIVASGSGHIEVRRSALDALGRLGTAAVPLLLAAFRDPARPAGTAVIIAMGRTRDERVLEPLIDTLEHNDASLRAAAIDALVAFGPTASSALNAALAQHSFLTRRGAAEVMSRWPK